MVLNARLPYLPRLQRSLHAYLIFQAARRERYRRRERKKELLHKCPMLQAVKKGSDVLKTWKNMWVGPAGAVGAQAGAGAAGGGVQPGAAAAVPAPLQVCAHSLLL